MITKLSYNLIKEFGKKTLGISRSKMPQIKDLSVFSGVKKEKMIVDPNVLKPTQSHIDSKKVESFKGDVLSKPVIVAKDNRIIDGHHRWAKAMTDDNIDKLKIVKVDMNIDEALKAGMKKEAVSKQWIYDRLYNTALRSMGRSTSSADEAVASAKKIVSSTKYKETPKMLSALNSDRITKRRLGVNPVTVLPFGQKPHAPRFKSVSEMTEVGSNDFKGLR